MARKMRGNAWVFQGLLDVDVMCGSYDVIRAKGLMEKEISLGKYAMIGVDPSFPNKVQKGDFIVGGEGVGYGHDHDHPCKAIRGAGVAAIICVVYQCQFLIKLYTPWSANNRMSWYQLHREAGGSVRSRLGGWESAEPGESRRNRVSTFP